jgi:uncharacterized membrane protein
MKVLLVGETWIVHSIHMKGFDQFHQTAFGEGAGPFKVAMAKKKVNITHIANHDAFKEFPYTLEGMKQYDCIIFSDIGSNTILLPDETFMQGQQMPNRLELVKEYVANGGAFLMIGGYMAFSGIDGRSRYEQTAIGDILPVLCLGKDDRIEKPEGVIPTIVKPNHEVMKKIPTKWSHFLGYNKTILKEGAELIATIGNYDPFIAVWSYGKGKTAAFTSDFAPHWGPKSFTESDYYADFFYNLIQYIAK